MGQPCSPAVQAEWSPLADLIILLGELGITATPLPCSRLPSGMTKQSKGQVFSTYKIKDMLLRTSADLSLCILYQLLFLENLS